MLYMYIFTAKRSLSVCRFWKVNYIYKFPRISHAARGKHVAVYNIDITSVADVTNYFNPAGNAAEYETTASQRVTTDNGRISLMSVIYRRWRRSDTSESASLREERTQPFVMRKLQRTQFGRTILHAPSIVLFYYGGLLHLFQLTSSTVRVAP